MKRINTNIKYVFIVLSVIVLTVSLGVGFFLYNKRAQPEIVNQVGITTEECTKKGGEIVNILDDERAGVLEFRRDHKAEFCDDSNAYLGDVTSLHCPCICCKKQSFTKEQAISSVKKKYAHMSDFPYEGLPPKSITAEKYQDDWYLAFIQEGSGRPIIEARCFIVKPNGDVIENGKFVPKFGINKDLYFSVRKCENSE